MSIPSIGNNNGLAALYSVFPQASQAGSNVPANSSTGFDTADISQEAQALLAGTSSPSASAGSNSGITYDGNTYSANQAVLSGLGGASSSSTSSSQSITDAITQIVQSGKAASETGTLSNLVQALQSSDEIDSMSSLLGQSDSSSSSTDILSMLGSDDASSTRAPRPAEHVGIGRRKQQLGFVRQLRSGSAAEYLRATRHGQTLA